MAVSGKRLEKSTRTAIGITRNFCEACLDGNVTTVADGVCKECKEYMCNTCFQHHLKARQCRHHVLVDIDSTLVLEKDETCEQHTNEIIKYYCSSHDRVGCGDCMVLEHGDCKTDFIENFSKNFEEKEDFKVMVQQLESWESETTFHENKLKGDKKKVNTSHENALKKIRVFKTNMTKHFDEAESIILAEVDALNFEYDTLLEKLGEDLKALSSNIKRAKFRISTDNYRGKTLFVQFTQTKPEIVKIKQTLEQIKLDHDVSGYEFQPDEQLVDFLSSNRNLGSLVNILHSDPLEDFLQYAGADKSPEDGKSAEDDESAETVGDYKTVGDDKTEETVGDYKTAGDDKTAEIVGDYKTAGDDKTAGTVGDYKTAETVGDYKTAGDDKTAGTVGDYKTAETVGDYKTAGNDKTAETVGDYKKRRKKKKKRQKLGDYKTAETVGDYKTAGDKIAETVGYYKTAGDDEDAEPVVDDKTVEEYKTVKLENETGPICIGARVCPLPDCTLGCLSHNKKPGTIVYVESGGTITVRWDYSGQVKYGYRIGKSKCGNGIKLI